ncbi:hypothetical protein GN958_ATG03153 [Phytophthora infestans]|uniref:Uncharacterized protein n=1 Tax=Phytophthora infestans TaxID=4787 RepID=A0A8S9VB75_PHYIN|nr:hypothetical protein GN958_ATG03153 [Phytophthora infestans]
MLYRAVSGSVVDVGEGSCDSLYVSFEKLSSCEEVSYRREPASAIVFSSPDTESLKPNWTFYTEQRAERAN